MSCPSCHGSVTGYGPGLGSSRTMLTAFNPISVENYPPEETTYGVNHATEQNMAEEMAKTALWSVGGAVFLYLIGLTPRQLIFLGIGAALVKTYQVMSAVTQQASEG